MMMEKKFFTLAVLLIISSSLSAQTPVNNQEDPCLAVPFDYSASGFSFRMANQNLASPNIYIPCGGGTTEDNPVWWLFRAKDSTVTFKITSYNCLAGWSTYGTQITLWTKNADCSNLDAVICHVPAGNTTETITYETKPKTLYFWQFDGISETQCSFNIAFKSAELLPVFTVATGLHLDERAIQVVPNPSSSDFTFSLPAFSQKATYNLYNLQGQKLFSLDKVIPIGTEQVSETIDFLPQGIYFLAINIDAKNVVKKIIKL